MGKPGSDVIADTWPALAHPRVCACLCPPTQYVWLVDQSISTHLGLVVADKHKKRRLLIGEGAQANLWWYECPSQSTLVRMSEWFLLWMTSWWSKHVFLTIVAFGVYITTQSLCLWPVPQSDPYFSWGVTSQSRVSPGSPKDSFWEDQVEASEFLNGNNSTWGIGFLSLDSLHQYVWKTIGLVSQQFGGWHGFIVDLAGGCFLVLVLGCFDSPQVVVITCCHSQVHSALQSCLHVCILAGVYIYHRYCSLMVATLNLIEYLWILTE